MIGNALLSDFVVANNSFFYFQTLSLLIAPFTRLSQTLSKYSMHVFCNNTDASIFNAHAL